MDREIVEDIVQAMKEVDGLTAGEYYVTFSDTKVNGNEHYMLQYGRNEYDVNAAVIIDVDDSTLWCAAGPLLEDARVGRTDIWTVMKPVLKKVQYWQHERGIVKPIAVIPAPGREVYVID